MADEAARTRVVLRLCEERDLEAITRLTNHAIEDSWAHFGTERVDIALVRAHWLANRVDYPWLVAELRGNSAASVRTKESNAIFAGFARGAPWKSRGGYAWTVETAVYIQEHAQRRGIATMLYTALLRVLSAQGYRVALGGVAQPNEASDRLHRAVGMTALGSIEPAGFKQGGWRAVRYYQRLLGEGDRTPPGEIQSVESVLDTIDLNSESSA